MTNYYEIDKTFDGIGGKYTGKQIASIKNKLYELGKQDEQKRIIEIIKRYVSENFIPENLELDSCEVRKLFKEIQSPLEVKPSNIAFMSATDNGTKPEDTNSPQIIRELDMSSSSKKTADTNISKSNRPAKCEETK